MVAFMTLGSSRLAQLRSAARAHVMVNQESVRNLLWDRGLSLRLSRP
jgi:hypothetical protein